MGTGDSETELSHSRNKSFAARHQDVIEAEKSSRSSDSSCSGGCVRLSGRSQRCQQERLPKNRRSLDLNLESKGGLLSEDRRLNNKPAVGTQLTRLDGAWLTACFCDGRFPATIRNIGWLCPPPLPLPASTESRHPEWQIANPEQTPHYWYSARQRCQG
jgi:hypothetical protein